jgi:hypothetical protein
MVSEKPTPMAGGWRFIVRALGSTPQIRSPLQGLVECIRVGTV